MNRLWRYLRQIRLRPVWLGAAVLSGILLHLVTVLAAPHLAANRSYASLAKLGAVNKLTVLAPVAAGRQPLAYLSPTERYAICPFDLRRGPVTLRARLADDDWLVAIYAPNGANVFSVSGADLARRTLELVLATKDNDAGLALPIAGGDAATSLSLDERTGIAVIQAPATRASEAAQTQHLLEAASCTQLQKNSGG